MKTNTATTSASATTATAEELLSFGYKLAQKRGFRADSIDDAAQEFAIGAWLAQKGVDTAISGGAGYVTRGGLNGVKAYVRQQMKATRFTKKGITIDALGDEYLEETTNRLYSGDYNAEDGEAALSIWDTIAGRQEVDALALADDCAKARAALETLNSREREVLLARGEGQTLAQIGAAIGVSRERVRQIEEAARAKAMRHF